MSRTVLVTYATRYGSTQEVAEAIAQTLRTEGVTVDLRDMRGVDSLNNYGAVVMGAPLYIGKWHEDAHRFITQHLEALKQKPVAIFALGPLSTDPAEMEDCRHQLEKDLQRYDWLTPMSQEMFVGKFDPSKLNFLHRLLRILPASPLRVMPASDYRNWQDIRTWASDLAPQLGI